jgi:hypothetical protein
VDEKDEEDFFEPSIYSLMKFIGVTLFNNTSLLSPQIQNGF